MGTSGLHHQFLLQRMFTHAEAMGKREYNHSICRGRQKPSAEQDLKEEPSTIELISPDSTERRLQKSTVMCTSCEGFWGSCSVMRRWRSVSAKRFWIPSRNTSSVSGSPYCCGRGQVGALLAPLGTTPRLTYSTRNHATYDRFKDMK